MRSARQSKANRAATIVAGLAAALLIAAAGINWWGARRELSRIQEERALLKPQIAATLVGRTTIETAYQQLGALADASHRAPRWSAVLAALSTHLSDDAYLTAFRGRGDSVFVDGLADRASQVFDDMARTPGLRGVIATAPVRRETQENGEALEHFTLGAALAGSERPQPERGPRSTSARPAP
jgi:Tfp pilus assembly protein PilN